MARGASSSNIPTNLVYSYLEAPPSLLRYEHWATHQSSMYCLLSLDLALVQPLSECLVLLCGALAKRKLRSGALY